MTRTLFLAAAAVALSGCSWIGLGGSSAAPTYAPGGTYAAAAAPCCDERLSTWNLEASGGLSQIISGDLVTGSRASGGTVVNGIPNQLETVTFDGAYQDGWRAEAGLSRALTPNRKVTLLGNYTRHESEGVVDLGVINGAALSGEVTDYESYGAELGLRQYAPIYRAPLLKSVRPYVEGRVGVNRVDSISLVNANQFPGQDIRFYDGTWVPTAAGLVGVETPFIGNSTLGLETGVRYAGSLKSADSLGSVSPLSGANNGGERWSVPVTLRGRFRF